MSTVNICDQENTEYELIPEALRNALLSLDSVSENNFNKLCSLANISDRRLCLLLVENGLVSDSNMANIQSEILGYDLVSIKDFPTNSLVNTPLPRQFLRDSLTLPLNETDDSLTLAMADATDSFVISSLAMLTKKTIHIKVALRSHIEDALERLYGDGSSRIADMIEEIETVEQIEDYSSIEQLKDMAGEAPIIRLVNFIITHAVEERVSDIHIEPFEHQLKVRYRIDGVLHETEAPPIQSTAAVISRIKIMGKMNIAETRLPQDGRIQIRTQGKLIELRVSTVPTMHGESVVMRILDKEHVQFDLSNMSFSGTAEKQIYQLLKLTHGIILVTGPTGSGKTTTLYAALQWLNSPDKKILTVEDPVEYQLDGINQIQIKPKIGLHFAEALRSIVRQDPDIIMIGEMRDLETSRIAVQSALTGHLVLSTLHTNDAVGSIIRLLDMGIEDYLLTSTLNGVLGQRLVRKLCTKCCTRVVAVQEIIDEFKLHRYTEDPVKIYTSNGCELCTQTGYLGRLMISELLVFDETIRRMIIGNADALKLRAYGYEQGMLSMYEDGLCKVLAGVTTIEEVLRVTQEN